MEGGRIVQMGTAREIIAGPVNDYVADFVAHMNPLGVLTARDVMIPGEAGAGARSAAPQTAVKDIMQMMAEGVDEIAVVEGGKAIGVIRSAGLMARLIDPRGKV